MTDAIKPCPFPNCGEPATLEKITSGFQVQCTNCWAAGPAEHTEDEAITAWNAAPRPAPARTCGTCRRWTRNGCRVFNVSWSQNHEEFTCADHELRPATGQENNHD